MVSETIEFLGLRTENPLSAMVLIDVVTEGLPIGALDHVCHALAPGDTAFPFRMVPRATLTRRRKALAFYETADATPSPEARLSPDESARVARLAEVWAFSLKVWGSDEAARDFLFHPHMLLEGRRPVDVVLANEFGRPLVDGILGRLLYGSAV